MDRDPNKTYGTTGASGAGSSGANPGFQNTGADLGTGGMNAGAAGGAASGREFGEGTEGSRDLGDRAREARDTAKERLGQARETASEKMGQARNKAHELKHSFADKLDAGADKLRSRATAGDPAYATADGMSAISTTDSQGSGVKGKVAGGMHSTAEWLRENDMDSMKRGVEEQVRTNPGRSLLVAAVAGYLIGKVLRR